MSATSIEWTDESWNPVRGCVKISPGCKHCYAETLAERFRGVEGHAYEQGFDPRLVPEMLGEPVTWEKPRGVFVNSMSDVFLESVPDDYIEAIVDVMLAARWHTYQVLTKRAKRMAELLRGRLLYAADAPHIWWGVSVEDRKHGVPRIAELQRAPVRTRFLSVEPLLEDVGVLDLRGISWVIVGGESGPGARPMRPEWVRSVRDQCAASGAMFFFKQWGGVNKKKHGRVLDGRTHDDAPELSPFALPSRAARSALAKTVMKDIEPARFELMQIGTKKKSPAATRNGRSTTKNATTTLFTFGYDKLDERDIVAVLKRKGVRRVVDVRYKATRSGIQAAAEQAELEWVHVQAAGNPYYKVTLKNRPKGLALYAKHLDEHPEAVDETLAAVESGQAVLLCVCRKPSDCHRTILAARMKLKRRELNIVDIATPVSPSTRRQPSPLRSR